MVLLTLAAVLAWSPQAAPDPVAPDPVVPAPAADAGPARAGDFERIYVRSTGLDDATLLEAVRLRVPHVEWIVFGVAMEPVGPDNTGGTAVAQLRVTEPDTAELAIVVADGRAFDRQIDIAGMDSDERVRAVASTIANLVAGIEAGTVAPDRSDVPLPVPVTPPPPLVCPETVKPECPAVVVPPPIEPAPTKAPPPAPRSSLGIVAGTPIMLGLGAPTESDRYAGWGGEFGVRYRFVRGATLMADLRASGRASIGNVRVIRGRLALGAGYTLRRGPFELAALAFATVEPWSVRLDGSAASFLDANNARVLVGGGVRLAPGLRVQPPGASYSLRVGPYAGFHVSGNAADGFAVPQIILASQGAASRLRAGGLEATLGVQAVLWFDVRKRKR